MEGGERGVGALLSRIRPRVSLASGSILVLLTLFLPIGYEACGPERRGYELVQGSGEWPTFLGVLVSSQAGQDFYILVLALAAFTAILVLLSFVKPDLCRKPPLTHRLFTLTGTASLFLMSDVILILPFAEERYGWAAFGLGLISCLSPGLFWPRKIVGGWLSSLAIPISLFFIADSMRWWDGDGKTGLTYTFVGLYALVPLGVWWFGGSSRERNPSQWIRIRRGLSSFYLPAVVGNIWFFVVAWREGLWGFVPCYCGIHLMAIGYMRLAKEGELLPAGGYTQGGS
jgi:hypothetical protein